MNNLEWMYRNDKSFRDFCQWTLKEHPFTFGMVFETREDAGKWLLAEHVDDESCNQDAEQGERQESPDCESDSREKLEAEVRKWCGMYPYQVDMVWVWLNRQAAITTNQLTSKSDVSKPEETAENAISKCDMRDFGDSREKLEADMRERLGELWADAWDAGSRDSMDDNFDLSVFIALLDRQAAIDRKEFETILEEIQECMRNGSR